MRSSLALMLLKPHKISPEEAGQFWRASSQRKHTIIDPNDMPSDGVEYWRCGGVCIAFHQANWPDVHMCHLGVVRDDGDRVLQARAILSAYWGEAKPVLIIGWIASLSAVRFAQRVGFEITGKMSLPSGRVTQLSWRL